MDFIGPLTALGGAFLLSLSMDEIARIDLYRLIKKEEGRHIGKSLESKIPLGYSWAKEKKDRDREQGVTNPRAQDLWDP
jgi:hypothetical protein